MNRAMSGRVACAFGAALLACLAAACDGGETGSPGGSGGTTLSSGGSGGSAGAGGSGGADGGAGAGGGSTFTFEGFDSEEYVIPQECLDACALAASCGGEAEAPCQELCAARYFFYTFAAPAGCWSSFGELLGCIAGLDCQEYLKYSRSGGAEGPCAAAHGASVGDAACNTSPPPCPDYCAKRSSCDAALDTGLCELRCGADLGEAGKKVSLTCFDALTAYLECAAARSCEELSAHAGCEPEEGALPGACL